MIGVAADGTGYGTDGTIWGCEIMVANLLGFERLAHLANVPLPGGEQAVRQPWRMGAVYLSQTFGDAFIGLDIPFVQEMDRSTWRTLSQMIVRGINSPQTSSLGRLFDAVAAILGIRTHALYEGQAAIELEMHAASCLDDLASYPFAIDRVTQRMTVVPLINAIVRDIELRVPTALIAKRFHATIADMLAIACYQARARTGLNVVALSGGVFQNCILLELLATRLEEMSFVVYTNRRVPPNDGGISLGQAAVAAARLQKG